MVSPSRLERRPKRSESYHNRRTARRVAAWRGARDRRKRKPRGAGKGLQRTDYEKRGNAAREQRRDRIGSGEIASAQHRARTLVRGRAAAAEGKRGGLRAGRGEGAQAGREERAAARNRGAPRIRVECNQARAGWGRHRTSPPYRLTRLAPASRRESKTDAGSREPLRTGGTRGEGARNTQLSETNVIPARAATQPNRTRRFRPSVPRARSPSGTRIGYRQKGSKGNPYKGRAMGLGKACKRTRDENGRGIWRRGKRPLIRLQAFPRPSCGGVWVSFAAFLPAACAMSRGSREAEAYQRRM